MSRFEPSAVREVATVATRAMGYKGMKPEQLKVVKMFVRGNDVFGVLPIGYGKSLCYACLPLLFDNLLSSQTCGFSIVLVVSPLVALRAKRLFTYLCLIIFIE